jgi:hypothetical protein
MESAFIALLEQGSIASAGGGYTDTIVDSFELNDALRFRVVSKRCIVLAQRYRSEVLLCRDLALLLKCFPHVERIVREGPTRVSEIHSLSGSSYRKFGKRLQSALCGTAVAMLSAVCD